MILETDENGHCSYLGGPCRKLRNSKNGVCVAQTRDCLDPSLDGDRPFILCPQRMLPALGIILGHHYGSDMGSVVLVPEQPLREKPPTKKIDYVSVLPGTRNMAAIEVQTIGIRGNIGEEYHHLLGDDPEDFESRVQGTNQADMLGLLIMQLVQKGSFLRHIGMPCYVLIQEPNLNYLMNQIPVAAVPPAVADITIFSVDLDGDALVPVRTLGVNLGELAQGGSLLGALSQRYVGGLPSPQVALATFEDRVIRRAENRGLYHGYRAEVWGQLQEELGAMCQCGHSRREHDSEGACTSGEVVGFDGPIPETEPCPCTGFVATESTAPPTNLSEEGLPPV